MVVVAFQNKIYRVFAIFLLGTCTFYIG